MKLFFQFLYYFFNFHAISTHYFVDDVNTHDVACRKQTQRQRLVTVPDVRWQFFYIKKNWENFKVEKLLLS